MLSRLLRNRVAKPAVQILVFLLLYFAVKTYMQRDLATGAAPLLQTRLLDGSNFDLHAHQGKPVLLYFFATWCPVCKLQHASISDLSADHVVVAVAIDSGMPSQLKSYLDQHQANFPVIADADGTIANRFGVKGVPTSFIIDANGDIAFTETGYTTGWGLSLRLWLAR